MSEKISYHLSKAGKRNSQASSWDVGSSSRSTSYITMQLHGCKACWLRGSSKCAKYFENMCFNNCSEKAVCLRICAHQFRHRSFIYKERYKRKRTFKKQRQGKIVSSFSQSNLSQQQKKYHSNYGSRQANAAVQWCTNMPSTMSDHHCFQSAIVTLLQCG